MREPHREPTSFERSLVLVAAGTNLVEGRSRSQHTPTATKRWEHIAGCAGSGKTTLLVERVKSLRQAGTRRNQVVVVSFSSAGVQALEHRVGEDAVVLLAEVAKSPKVTETLVNDTGGTLHLLLCDVHRASKGQLARLLLRLGPASLFSVGASVFEYPQVVRDAGWKLVEHVLQHSFRVPPGHMTLVNALAKVQGYVQVESTEPERVRLPTLHLADDSANLQAAVIRRIKQHSAKGVLSNDLCVVCSSAQHARDVAKHLNAESVPALAQRDEEFLPELRRVLWLVHSVMSHEPGDCRFVPEQSQRLQVAIGRSAWTALQKELHRVRGKTLESIFKECYRAYLWVKGGMNEPANRELRNFLSSWEAQCIGKSSARQLLKVVRSIRNPVMCLTPHAVRGRAWKHVIVAGVDDGVWKSRRGAPDAVASSSIVELMHLTCTRATRSVSIIAARSNDPTRVLARFTGCSLPPGSLRILPLAEAEGLAAAY